MSVRDYVVSQIDTLSEQSMKKVAEFIAFQKFSSGYADESDYLMSVPGMVEKIESASREPLSNGVTVSELWSDV